MAKRLSDILFPCSLIQYCPVWIFSFPHRSPVCLTGEGGKNPCRKKPCNQEILEGTRVNRWEEGEDKSEMIHLSGNLDVDTEGAGRECLPDFSKATRHLSVSRLRKQFLCFNPSIHSSSLLSLPRTPGTSHSHVQFNYKKAWSMRKLAWILLSTKKFHPGITYCCRCP